MWISFASKEEMRIRMYKMDSNLHIHDDNKMARRSKLYSDTDTVASRQSTVIPTHSGQTPSYSDTDTQWQKPSYRDTDTQWPDAESYGDIDTQWPDVPSYMARRQATVIPTHIGQTPTYSDTDIQGQTPSYSDDRHSGQRRQATVIPTHSGQDAKLHGQTPSYSDTDTHGQTPSYSDTDTHGQTPSYSDTDTQWPDAKLQRYPHRFIRRQSTSSWTEMATVCGMKVKASNT
ncbi:hypothetical protein RRG08_035189 [Elysia crispata]|uniref:Uncharacterized protein n=1 Tax=Elysia crispata TaxID=231223 RepID=A0AAE1APV3_9GAST|nr:hypothetical protein RRG08_035189 [Elysia crispata]